MAEPANFIFSVKCSPMKAAESRDRANRKVKADLEVKMRRKSPKRLDFKTLSSVLF